ncbi:helix-turn-helix domain-containing protein [Bifidobacterium callitrichos]|uniref:HTH cro/C1-type domain-containing protein n=1 Tax=Bifidobacterium callitrichos DSM 23973 TaxID=1437609 RepID=A0A087ACQ0_9BIFI|nr:helix-turn-helix transcriptional regulator [Bifidobacterium callitrichos]KFI56550.1 hypothetical protein BCAL_0145 [Bifidobacterium callitrichos DSM 23973]
MSNTQDERSHRFSQLIGLELKASFARHETSQAEVAEKLGHSKSGYSRWLNAKPSMPMEAMINTCELIGVDPRNIFDAAYRRLIEEMGPANAGERIVSLDDIAADEQSAIEETLRAYRDNPVDLAASHSSHKHEPDPEPGA